MAAINVYKFILFPCIAAIILLPSFIFGPGYSHSFNYNYIWTSQFGQEIANGTIYPQWLPDSFEGLGSPTFYFYPPLTFWIAGLLDAIGFSTLTAINLTAFVALTLSGVTMYHWLSVRGGWATTGALLYMIAPYHIMDFYIRGALAEFMAFLWLPLIALGMHNLPQRRGIILFALSYAGLILTHLPLAMLASFFLILPLAIYALWMNKRVFWPLTVSGGLAFGLSAFYLLGALTLQGAISTDLMQSLWYQPSSWFILNPNNLFTNYATVALAVGAVLLAWQARSVWTAITILCALASLGLIPFIWQMEPLIRAQFPWRLLSIIEFAVITAWMLRPRFSPWFLGLGGGMVVYAWIIWAPEMKQRQMLAPPYGQLQQSQPDAPEYLPAGFSPKSVSALDRVPDLSGARHLPRGDRVKVNSTGETVVGRANFPIWQVTRDGKPVPHGGPLIHFQASPGWYRIERRVIWQESVGAAISVAASLLLFAIGFSAWKRRGLKHAYTCSNRDSVS